LSNVKVTAILRHDLAEALKGRSVGASSPIRALSCGRTGFWAD